MGVGSSRLYLQNTVPRCHPTLTITLKLKIKVFENDAGRGMFVSEEVGKEGYSKQLRTTDDFLPNVEQEVLSTLCLSILNKPKIAEEFEAQAHVAVHKRAVSDCQKAFSVAVARRKCSQDLSINSTTNLDSHHRHPPHLHPKILPKDLGKMWLA